MHRLVRCGPDRKEMWSSLCKLPSSAWVGKLISLVWECWEAMTGMEELENRLDCVAYSNGKIGKWQRWKVLYKFPSQAECYICWAIFQSSFLSKRIAGVYKSFSASRYVRKVGHMGWILNPEGSFTLSIATLRLMPFLCKITNLFLWPLDTELDKCSRSNQSFLK